MPDDFDSAAADRFKLLDHVRVPDTWSRVELKVLDNRPASDTWSPGQFTGEVVTMIDVKTTDPAEPRQKRPMRVVVAGILAAAAAIVAVAFVMIRDADDVTPADEPSSTATVPPTTAPRALPNTTGGGTSLVPGTYFVDSVNGTKTPRIFVTLGTGGTDIPTSRETSGRTASATCGSAESARCSQTRATRALGISRGPWQPSTVSLLRSGSSRGDGLT